MSPETARALAEEWFNGGRGHAFDVAIYAFDDGFVAWVRDDEPADLTVLPATVRGGCIVIDRRTGELAVRPLLGLEFVAEQWPDHVPR